MKREIIQRLQGIVQHVDVEDMAREVFKLKRTYHDYDGKDMDFGAPESELDGKFENLITEFEQRRENLKASKELALKNKIYTKKLIIEDLKDVIENEGNIGTAFDRVKVIQTRWKESPRVPAEVDKDLYLEYKHHVDVFYHNVRIAREFQDGDYKKNLEKKRVILAEMEKLADIEDVREAEKQLKKHQAAWRAAGMIPRANMDEIMPRYKAIGDAVYVRINEYYEGRRGELDDNLRKKIALCEDLNRVVALECKTFKDWQERTNQVVDFQKQWREIGFSSENEQVWGVFRNISDRFFDAKRDYFDVLDQQRANNSSLKAELCVQAEEMSTLTDWKNTTERLIKLQKEWKGVGPGLRKDEQKLWERFRAACDAFFEAKKNHFQGQAAEQMDNLEKKNACIEGILAMEISEDTDANYNRIKELSAEFASIGFVPFKHKDNVYDRYRAALDAKYGELKLNRSQQDELDKSAANAPGGNSAYVDYEETSDYAEERQLRDKISKLQEEVLQYENNLGFFGGKTDNPMVQEIEQKVAKLKSELGGLRSQLKVVRDKIRAEIAAEDAAKEAATAAKLAAMAPAPVAEETTSEEPAPDAEA